MEERGVESESALEEGKESDPLTKTADELCDWLWVLSKTFCCVVVSEFWGFALAPHSTNEAELFLCFVNWLCDVEAIFDMKKK